MSASYPTSIASFTTKTNGQTILPAHINDLQAEIVAIETGLKSGFAHALLPLTDAAYDLGSASKQWKALYLSGAATIGGALTLTGNFSVNGSEFVVLAASGNTTVAGTLAVGSDFSVNTTKAMITAATGNTTLLGYLLTGAGAWPTSTIGQSGSRVGHFSSTEDGILLVGNMQSGVAADRGGSLYLSARGTTAVDNIAFAIVRGARSNGTSGDFSTYLDLQTSNAAGTVATKARLSSAGGLSVGSTTDPGAGSTLATRTLVAEYAPAVSTTSVNNLAFTGNVIAPDSGSGGPFTYTITGLAAPVASSSAVVVISNVGGEGADTVVLKHASASSTITNRFQCATGADISLAAGEWAFAFYASKGTVTGYKWQVKKM